MSKRAAITKATGAASHTETSERALLQTEDVTALAQHLGQAISSVPGGRKTKPSRSACSQLALQVLMIAAGLRRAALVDTLSLTAAQASAVSLMLEGFWKQKTLLNTSNLQQVRLLHHAATGQTFVVSRQPRLWTDIADLHTAGRADKQSGRLWIDARLTQDHALPTRTHPDPHIGTLLQAVHEAVIGDTSGDALIVSQVQSDTTIPRPDEQFDDQLVGVALAGFLLEYGAVYTMHNNPTKEAASHYAYQVQPFGVAGKSMLKTDLVASPPNCLGSQPLCLFKVIWSGAFDSSFEVLSFSVPQCVMSQDETGQARQRLKEVFGTRLDALGADSIFVNGRISVHVTEVTLHQVSL